MPAESRPHQVAAQCGDPKALVRFSDRGQQSGNQSRARQTRRVPVEQEQRPRNRDDCLVPGAGLRDNIIAGPIIMPVYVYLPLEQETFLDLGVIMLGQEAPGSMRSRAVRSPVGGSTRSIFNCTPGAISSHTPSDRRRATEGPPPTRRSIADHADTGGVFGETCSNNGANRRDQASTARRKSGSSRMRRSTVTSSSASSAPSTNSPAKSSDTSGIRVTRV